MIQMLVLSKLGRILMKLSRDLLMFFLYGQHEEKTTKEPLPVLDSLPSDITIGYSMLPAAKYGVFARQPILRGLVVGPLNLPLGQNKGFIKTEESPEQKLIHKSWSWLKYIQPARHPYEENSTIEHTAEGIFFRITQDINVGCEILAWFSDSSLKNITMEETALSPSSSVSPKEHSSSMSPDKKMATQLPISPVARKPLVTTVPRKLSPSPLKSFPPQLPLKPLISSQLPPPPVTLSPPLKPMITSSQFLDKPDISSPQSRPQMTSHNKPHISPPPHISNSILSPQTSNSLLTPHTSNSLLTHHTSNSLLLPHRFPDKCLVSPTPLPSKAVCRLCGDMFLSYVELWAHVTTSHASMTPLSTTPFSVSPLSTPTTVLHSSATTSVLPTTPLPYPLPLLPLNLGLPLTRPYPLVPPRDGKRSPESSSSPSFHTETGDTVTKECRDTERPYECGHCGKSFALPSSLRRHIITHTGERPYKCGYCGRAFAGATTLNNHIRIHTGEKPHVCHDCGAGFTQATQLNRHIRCCPNSKNSSIQQRHSEIFVS